MTSRRPVSLAAKATAEAVPVILLRTIGVAVLRPRELLTKLLKSERIARFAACRASAGILRAAAMGATFSQGSGARPCSMLDTNCTEQPQALATSKRPMPLARRWERIRSPRGPKERLSRERPLGRPRFIVELLLA